MSCTAIFSTSSQSPVSRQIVAAVGTVFVIGAIAFAIIGAIQPTWFTQGVGTIGNPQSWALWTVSGSGLLIGIALISYSVIQRPSDSTPSFLKNSLHSKKKLSDLFGSVANVPTYREKLATTGELKKELMTKSVMKGNFVHGPEFLILRMRRVPPPDAIGEYHKETTLLLIMRHEKQWKQWHSRFENETNTILTPIFLRQFGYSSGGWSVDPHENEYEIKLEEEGLSKIKKLMKGEKVTDYWERAWELDV